MLHGKDLNAYEFKGLQMVFFMVFFNLKIEINFSICMINCLTGRIYDII